MTGKTTFKRHQDTTWAPILRRRLEPRDPSRPASASPSTLRLRCTPDLHSLSSRRVDSLLDFRLLLSFITRRRLSSSICVVLSDIVTRGILFLERLARLVNISHLLRTPWVNIRINGCERRPLCFCNYPGPRDRHSPVGPSHSTQSHTGYDNERGGANKG